ncbi:synaptic vesicle glycoprotein 2C-like isoform X2 [Patiria miniata]|uniref:Major facilitator superfamily (MFS) profile domain-containing protein n=1 Tax=Patiria miniata TaxID=46514 RepID=A0A914BQN4_PATMI|nr:synaptic vesicle glycoprotein 2C-like isoform X2 [Patiria miniata]
MGIHEDSDDSEELEDSYQLAVRDPRGRMEADENRRLLKDVSDAEGREHLIETDPAKLGNFDEALEKAGFGKFHVLLVILCGWANASDAVEILSVSFLLPAAEKDLDLDSYKKGVLSAIIFVGMLVGGYIWGALADINGRRRTLLLSLTTNAFFGLMSSLSQVYWLFLLMRFFSGVGVGGSIPVIFSYCGEFQPKEKRGMMISVVATFWMAGNIVAAGLALLVIPSGVGYVNPGGFSYDSWRVFVALCTLPALTSVVTFFLMPESPKFLLENGQGQKALEVLKTIYSWNKWDDRANYPLKTLIPSERARVLSTDHGGRRTCSDRLNEAGKNIRISLQMTVQLFKKPLTWATVPLLLIIWTISFGYYGIWMWMPQLFLQSENGNGSVCSVDPNDVNSTSAAPKPGDNTIYLDSFYTSLSNLPGNLVAIFLIDIVGRKILMSTSLLMSGVIVFFIWFVKTRLEVLIVFCCFGAVSVVTWNVLNVLAVEIYPTHMRSTSLGVQGIVNRLASIVGNLIFGILIKTHCTVNILLVAALLVFGGLMTCTLPRTKKMSLQ